MFPGGKGSAATCLKEILLGAPSAHITWPPRKRFTAAYSLHMNLLPMVGHISLMSVGCLDAGNGAKTTFDSPGEAFGEGWQSFGENASA